MSDPIVTRHISPYVAIQGLERDLAPVPHPMASFEDTTHAYECGYRDGIKAVQAKHAGIFRCDGCGRVTNKPENDLETLRKAGHLSCCPERKMVPLADIGIPISGDLISREAAVSVFNAMKLLATDDRSLAIATREEVALTRQNLRALPSQQVAVPDLSSLQRYVPAIEYGCDCCGGDAPHMEQDEDGEYVLLEDVEALLAAMPSQQAQGVKVKPLVWVHELSSSRWGAGGYTILDDGEGYEVYFVGINLAYVGHDSGPSRLDHAMQCAQEHHEAYVLDAISALEPATAQKEGA